MIGSRLRSLREDAGLTQSQLGEIVTLGKHSISAFELDKNEPSDETKTTLARYFGVSVDYLLGLTDDPKPNWGTDCGYIKLPARFPPGLRSDAEQYIRFLAQKLNG